MVDQVTHLAPSLQIPANAATLQNFTCSGVAVTSAVVSAIESSRRLFQIGTYPLLFLQQLGIAPGAVVLADVSLLQSVLGSVLEKLQNVTVSVVLQAHHCSTGIHVCQSSSMNILECHATGPFQQKELRTGCTFSVSNNSMSALELSAG